MNQKKIKNFLLIALLSGLSSWVSAQTPTVKILGESTTNPSPGTTMYVTISVCDSFTFNSNPDTRPKVMAAIISGSGITSMSASCSTANQYLVVDNIIAGNIASGPGMYDQTNGAQGVGGPPVYPNINVVANASCASNAVTAVWPIYIDGNVLSAGSYSFVVISSEDYITCNPGPYSSDHFNFTLPLPPAAFTITKRAEGTTAAPNGFILFSIDYSFVNTNNFIISDAVPANTSFVTMGPSGTNSSGALTWSLGNATNPQKGTVWFLASVNPGTADGTIINNTASGKTNEVATANSNSVAVTVQIPKLTLKKSESATSLAAGSNVTYNLDWVANGKNLQMYDSYDNITAGSGTSSAAVPWGFDGTNYAIAPAGGVSGTWTVQSDAQGNHYIDATVGANCGGGTNKYPELIRNVPGLNICSDFIVEGDLQIPNSTSCPAGADCHMVLATNPSQGITLKAAISIDNNPGNLFIQKNNIYPLPAGASMAVGPAPFVISAGVWYTLQAEVQCSGTGTITYIIVLWPKGSPAKAVTLNYADNTAIQPICSGGWRQGWQVDETSGEDWYSNLKVFGPGPIVNPSVMDAVPAGITYGGSSVAPSSGPSPLVWNYAATLYSFDTPINWWGQVACPGPVTNSFTMNASGIPVTTSNSVTLTLSSCNTPTPTPTPVTGCKVLLYYDNEVNGLPMTNLINLLQSAGAQVTTIGVSSPTYNPGGDAWGTYTQVWDARFYQSAINYCPSTDYGDYFNANWQSTAVSYLNNGGNFYLCGENNGFPSRNDANGNGAFLQTLGVVTNSFISCPTASGPFNVANDDSTCGGSGSCVLPSTLPGTPNFFGDNFGGIPLSVMVNPGSSFVHMANTWNHSTVDRSVVQGWSGAAQLPGLTGPAIGKFIMCWDTTMWSAADYTANKTTVDAFFTTVYQWLGGTSCTTTTPTATPTNTQTPSPTSTPSCAQFTDNYGSAASLSNYSFNDGIWNPSTAAALHWSVNAGELQEAPPSGVDYSYDIVNNVLFSQTLGDYTVEGDFKLDTVSQGVFGLVFRSTASLAHGYIFQWNGLNSRWEIEKQTAPSTYYYPATNNSSPYTLGTWVHLKVVAGPGNLFNAYITPNGGPQQQIFSGSVDPGTTAPYTTGGAGIRSYNVVGGNVLHVKNFMAYNCPIAPTATPTSTPTSTPTLTPTPANTATFTPTPVGLHVWPIPYDPKYAAPVPGSNGVGVLKAYQVPADANMTIYTVSGELVFGPTSPDGQGYIYWDGKNKNGKWVSSGIYYYIIKNSSKTLLAGKILVIMDQ